MTRRLQLTFSPFTFYFSLFTLKHAILHHPTRRLRACGTTNRIPSCVRPDADGRHPDNGFADGRAAGHQTFRRRSGSRVRCRARSPAAHRVRSRIRHRHGVHREHRPDTQRKGLRRTDLVRWNLFTTESWWDKEPTPSTKNVFYIPNEAIYANPLLKQND